MPVSMVSISTARTSSSNGSGGGRPPPPTWRISSPAWPAMRGASARTFWSSRRTATGSWAIRNSCARSTASPARTCCTARRSRRPATASAASRTPCGSCVGWWRRGCRSSWSNTPPVQTARRRCCARSGSSGSSATSPPATSNRSHRPPSDADSRIVRNEGEIVEPVQRPRQRKIGDQRGDRRRRQEAQAQIGRSERQQRVSQRAVEYQEDRLQDAEHDTAVEIEHQRRAGDEQELEGGADQAEPQRSDLAILHVEKVDHDRRGQRDTREEDEL